MKATLHTVSWLIPQHLAAFSFKPHERFSFVPGEYTELHVAHASPDNRGQSREFSIASTPKDALVTIITTFPPNGQRQSTFKQALRALQPGDQVDLAQPRGDFVLPKDPSIPLVFVAGGIGVVPFMSMVESLATKNQQRDIQMIHTVNAKRALLNTDMFAHSPAIKSYLPLITGGSQPSLTGRVTGSQILQHTTPAPRTLFYISGPEAMTQELRMQLITAGIATTHIVIDAFNRYDP